MGDYFDQAGQGIDQGKAALLQAIATQGSQAHAALQAGQDQIAAAKQAAIQQALAGATQRGAKQPELDQLSRTVSQPYDAQLAGLASSAASRDAGFAQQGAAAGSYMDEARAGLPALRTELAQRVATLQAQARASEGQQQYQLEQSRIAAADRAATRAASAAKAAKPPGVGQILTDQFGGLSGFQDLVTQQAPALRAQQNADYRGQQSSLRALGAGGNLAARADSRESDPGLTPTDVADALGQSAGLPAGQGAALYQSYLDKQAATDQKAAGSADSIRGTSEYQSAAQELFKGVSAGTPTAGIAQALNDHYGPEIARQILSDYSAVLPAKPPYGG